MSPIYTVLILNVAFLLFFRKIWCQKHWLIVSCLFLEQKMILKGFSALISFTVCHWLFLACFQYRNSLLIGFCRVLSLRWRFFHWKSPWEYRWRRYFVRDCKDWTFTCWGRHLPWFFGFIFRCRTQQYRQSLLFWVFSVQGLNLIVNLRRLNLNCNGLIWRWPFQLCRCSTRGLIVWHFLLTVRFL